MQLRNLIRRQKWRLRPLKGFVLPWRNVKRLLVARWRRVPTISSARNYRGDSFCEAVEVYPAAMVASLPVSFHSDEAVVDLQSEPAFIFHLKNIEFWALYGGAVLTRDNQLLADLSPDVWGVENHRIFSRFRLPKARRLTGRTAIAVTPEAPGNYYHWLIDLLPRIGLLGSRKGGFEFFEHLLINGRRAPYELQSLAAVGTPLEKIWYVDARDRFQLEEAIIPSMDQVSRTVAPWKIDMLRTLGNSLPGAHSLTGRLYVSRRRAAIRRVVNERELEKVLQAANFTLVELETKSWKEQVAAFANVEVILAPHGAALANIAFCKPGTLVAEISTRGGYKDFYLQLAAAARLRYRFIEAQPRTPSCDSPLRPPENEDLIVDLPTIQEFLATL
jgi:capsular polysaccharide biosynthesis protein